MSERGQAFSFGFVADALETIQQSPRMTALGRSCILALIHEAAQADFLLRVCAAIIRHVLQSPLEDV